MGKSWKIHYKSPFSIAMLNYQRVGKTTQWIAGPAMVQWPSHGRILEAVGLPEQDLPPLWLVRSSPGARKKWIRLGPLGLWFFRFSCGYNMGFRWFSVICVLLIYIYIYNYIYIYISYVGFLLWYGPPIIQWILWYWSCCFIVVFHVEIKGCVRLGLNTANLLTLFFRAISCPISSASQHFQ